MYLRRSHETLIVGSMFHEEQVRVPKARLARWRHSSRPLIRPAFGILWRQKPERPALKTAALREGCWAYKEEVN